MTDRGVGIAVIAAAVAGMLGLLLFVGAVGGRFERPGDGEARVFFGDRPPPAARTIAQIQERVPGAVRPLVPVQRQVAIAFREAAGYLLVLLGVSAALLFARGAVVAGYRATLGGWRTHLRTFALGGALLAAGVSALVLTFISLLGVAAVPVPGPAGALESGVGVAVARGGGFVLGPAPVLQVGLTALGVAIVLVGIVVVIGLAAASWRLGDAVVSLRPLSRLGQGAPPTLVALLGVTLVYLVAQLPFVGHALGVAIVAYALGVVATARLTPAPAA